MPRKYKSRSHHAMTLRWCDLGKRTLLIAAFTTLVSLGGCSPERNERDVIEESLKGEFTHRDMKDLGDFYGNPLPSERLTRQFSGIE